MNAVQGFGPRVPAHALRSGNGRVFGPFYGEDQALAIVPAIKHDLERQSWEAHEYGPGRVTAERVFVPREGTVAEDDGWTLFHVYGAARDRSDVVILHARDFGGDPVATIRLPVRVL